ncbi:MAG: exodeoxyribonuclease V subunit gamma [Acidimicrobiales bacterium]
MALFVHHGAQLAPLADGLAGRLAAPGSDPFERIVVGVPTAGMRDWVTRHLAIHLGVSANVELPFPGRFVAAALGVGRDADDPWDVERLTWSVLDVLDAGEVDVPGWDHATRHGHDESRRFAVARRIADLFDRYAMNRPELLRQWQRGVPGDGTRRATPAGGASEPGDGESAGTLPGPMAWQFELWRAVRSRIGVASRAEQLPDLVAQLRSGELQPALPSVVELFGVSSVSPPQLDVLTALAEVRDVHVSVLHPSPVAWHRTPPLDHHRPPSRTAGAARRGEAAVAGDNHPLLQSWGRLSAETAALIRGVTPPIAIDHATIIPIGVPGSLLEHVRADLLADRPPTPYALRPGDTSIQVHACHGTVRQLEVLRDVLGHLFVADADLRPDDVLVVCPDLARFEPFAAAVFGRGTLPVPVTVSDLSLGAENPVATSLATIVRAMTGRCSASDVLGIAALDPVRRRLAISTDDLTRFAAWTERLATTWGLDGEHRRRWLDADITGGTWADAIQALLLGAAMPAPAARQAIGGVVPFDDIGGDDVPAAGRFAELIARLRRVRELVATPRPIDEWCDVLVDVLSLLCATAPTDAWQLAAVTGAIDDMRERSVVDGAPSASRLGLDDVVAVVDGLVAGPRGRLRLRSGRVAMTAVVPVRNVPAKVICLLGFDDESLRPPNTDGDDLLAVRPRVGERDRRAELRHLMLDALLAAQQTLIIMCDGNDVTTNRPQRFAVQLTELLDVVDATVTPATIAATRRRDDASAGQLDSPVLVRHPLRAFDERHFLVGLDAGARVHSFDDVMCRAAETRRMPRRAGDSPAGHWMLDIAPPDTVTLAKLTQACVRPSRTLLRDGLDVRLPGEIARADPNIPLTVTPLAIAGLGKRLLDRYRRRAADLWKAGVVSGWSVTADPIADVVAEWEAAERLAAAAPPGRLIDHVLASVADEIDRMVEVAAAASGLTSLELLAAEGAVAVDVDLAYTGSASPAPMAPGELRLTDSVKGIAGRTICRIGYRRPRLSARVGCAIDLAAAVLATEQAEWQAICVTRPSSRSTSLECYRLDITAADPLKAARQLLEAAVELHVAARCNAVPVFEQTTRDLYADGTVEEETLIGNEFQGGELSEPENQFVWGDITVTELESMTPSPRRLAELIWGSIDALTTITKLDDRERT